MAYKEKLVATPGAERAACKFAMDVQSAVNLYAITAEWLMHLQAMKKAGLDGDRLNNHPSTLVFVSKLVSLCRLHTYTDDRANRESLAFDACAACDRGEDTEYEVIPIP